MNKFLFIFFIFIISFNTYSKSGILDRVITIQIKDTPIRTILTNIEKIGGVKFSYNPDLINENKKVNLSIYQKTIRHGLKIIFENKIKFKEIGMHIVLLKKEDIVNPKKKVEKTKQNKTHYIHKGEITDENTNTPLNKVSIYDVDSKQAVLSNQNGIYQIEIPTSQNTVNLYYSKVGYRTNVVVFDKNNSNSQNTKIKLIKKTENIDKIKPAETKQIPVTIEDRAISGLIFSDELYTHSQNLQDINESRFAQISFVPRVSIGSKIGRNGLMTNNFSLNMLSGYSKSLKGLEFGGIANILKEDGKWAQFGGISNFVGGNFTGLQAGGILNIIKKDFNGIQFGGISNTVRQHFSGMQASGIVNSVNGYFYGIQMAGIANDVNGGVKGIQIAGLINSSAKDVFGLQIGGLTSLSKGGFVGAQISGLSNIAVKASYGLQISGLQNIAREKLVGAQIAGLMNIANKGINIFQTSGILNIAHKNNGIQISGIFNYSKLNNGLQIGLINTSYKSKGLSIGLINFVVKGYHKVELSANETFVLNAKIKSGTQRFYNIYSFGKMPIRNLYAAGLGFGTYFNLSDHLMLSNDFEFQFVFNDNKEYGQMAKYTPTLDYKIIKRLSVFVGPSFNITYSIPKYNKILLNQNSIYSEFSPNEYLNIWIGAQIGIRL